MKFLSSQYINATTLLFSKRRLFVCANTHRAARRVRHHKRLRVMQNAPPLIYASFMQLVKCSEWKLWSQTPTELMYYTRRPLLIIAERGSRSFHSSASNCTHLSSFKHSNCSADVDCGAAKLIVALRSFVVSWAARKATIFQPWIKALRCNFSNLVFVN